MTITIKQFTQNERVTVPYIQYQFLIEDMEDEITTVMIAPYDKHKMHQYTPPTGCILFSHTEANLIDLSLSGTFNTLDQFGYF